MVRWQQDDIAVFKISLKTEGGTHRTGGLRVTLTMQLDLEVLFRALLHRQHELRRALDWNVEITDVRASFVGGEIIGIINLWVELDDGHFTNVAPCGGIAIHVDR